MRRPSASALKRRVAENMRRLRHEQGLTLAALAKRADLHLRHIQRIEAAGANLTIGTLAKLATGLGVDVTAIREQPQRGISLLKYDPATATQRNGGAII